MRLNKIYVSALHSLFAKMDLKEVEKSSRSAVSLVVRQEIMVEDLLHTQSEYNS